MALLQPPTAAEDFTAYRDDPVGFCRDVLGFESATRRSTGEAYQFTILTDLAGFPRVAVCTGHGTGKTRTVAAANLWWTLSRPLSKALVVAPEFSRQVRHALFGEIAKLARRAKRPLPIEVLSGRVTVRGYGPEWGILGMPATEPERIEGQHAEGGVLLTMDECKGIGQDVLDALQGTLTSGDDSRLLVTSTPGGANGPFFKIVARGGSDWRTHRISAEDSSLVAPSWIEQRAKEWGRGSPMFQMRVAGEFSDEGDGVLLPFSDLEVAVGREVATGEGPDALGVDVGRSMAGDPSAVVLLRAGRVERIVTWRSTDTMQTVERVLHEAVRAGAKAVRVDEIGIGAGVVDRLRQMGLPVEGVNFGGRASDPTRFINLRAERYWGLRAAILAGKLALPADDDLLADLSSIRYSFTARGQIALEAKDDIRRRLGRSPDRADALALAWGSDDRVAQPWTVCRAAF